MARLGADVEQLDALAQSLASSADLLCDTATRVGGQVRSTWWRGVHADDFRSTWNGADRAALEEAAGVLRGLAADLRRQAADQRTTSDDAGVPGGPGGTPSAPSGDETWFDRILGSLEERLEEGRAASRQLRDLEGMTPDEQAASWASLGQADRDRLLALHPGALLTIEGLPRAIHTEAGRRYADQRYDEVAVQTSSAFFDAEVDVASFELEGHATGEYVVLGDGSVQMSLRLEGDIGREFQSAAGEAEGEVGISGEVMIAFDSPEEAEKFLQGLGEGATEGIGWRDALNPAGVPAKVVDNVYDYVMAEDVRDVRAGLYGGVSLEFDGGEVVEVEAEAQVEAFYDVIDGEKGLRASGAVDLSILGDDPDTSVGGARVEVSGELTLDANNDFESLVLKAGAGGSLPVEHLGIDVPGLDVGRGVDVEFVIDADNPYAAEISRAATSGDLAGATRLAADHGEVVVRQTSVVAGASDEREYKLAGQGLEYEWGVEHETATDVWIRPPGGDEFHHIDRSRA